MKNTWKFVVAGAAGLGAWTLYKKFHPNAKEEIKNSINKMKNSATKSIENMM